MRAKPACTLVKSLVSLATCMTLFASEEYAIRACPSSSCAILEVISDLCIKAEQGP